MIKADIKIDDREFKRAFARYASESKRGAEKVLRQQAKLFVRDAVKITPPNKNYKFNPAGGKTAIRNDLAKIFRASQRGVTNPEAIHQKWRRRNGRVKAKLETKIPVKGLAAYRKKVLDRVGVLASGWNAAAQKLGLNLPAWITRHGSRRGRVQIKISAQRMTITVVNAVRFIGDVKGINRRVQHALNNRARQMDKQMDDYAVKKAKRRAGLK